MSARLTREQRLVLHAQGHDFPDPRDRELLDRGVELQRRQRTAHRRLTKRERVRAAVAGKVRRP